jgi:hypothetical protein
MTINDHRLHEHDRSCYWDHLRCGWVCVPAAPATTEVEAEVEPRVEPEVATAR